MEPTQTTQAPAAPASVAAMTPQQREARAAAKISGINIPEGALSGEIAPAPQPGLEQPVVETGVQAEGEQTDQSAEGSELEELDFDGIKFTVPKSNAQKVRDAFMREADYTRKTQDVAERARVVTEQEKLLQLNRDFHSASVEDIAQIKALDSQLAQYANLNWQSLDSDVLLRTKVQYDQLKEARQRAAQTLDQKWGQFNAKRTEQLAALEKAGRDEATRRIPGFDDKKAVALKDYAKGKGYTDSEIAQMFFRAQDVEMIWKAQQFDSLPKGSVNQRVTQAPPVVRPGPVSASASEAGKALAAFKGAKTAREKEARGSEILARKMRLIT